MSTFEKPYREEKYTKSRKPQKEMPSFSSTLLDEIYRSIDAGAENPVKKQSVHRAAKTNIIEDEETRNFRRACLVEKWMEKRANEKPIPKIFPDSKLDNKSSLQDNNDVLFFSSTSSSNSDSSGALSSSDTEFFGPQTEPKLSCFATRPKPVRTAAPAQEEFSLFGDYQNNEKNKFRALKLYANLKKVKQPISPGGRLTSFINSLFNKSKKDDTIKTGFRDSNSKSQSACSSATSFSRSCLNKYSPGTREKMRDGAQRTVRFHPVSVIVDEELRPCGQRRVYDKGSDHKCVKPPLPIKDQVLADLKLRKMDKSGRDELKGYNSKMSDDRSVFSDKCVKPPLPIRDQILADLKLRKMDKSGKDELKGYNSKMSDDRSVFRKIDDDDDYDGMSDSSSDLFEIDHELPVYETTRAIGSRMIR